ncbi:MAG: methyltransferase domain-containing protein [Bacteroidota bacterium]
MSIGNIFRKIVGEKIFPIFGKLYRRIFVQIKLISQTFPEIKPNSNFLDIGGGDGELLNLLLERFPDINITMIDISGNIGSSIKNEFTSKVDVLPSTSMLEYKEKYPYKASNIDFILISDVIHHVLPSQRPAFFNDLTKLINPKTTIVFKDVEPGFFISKLGYLADKYISGDKTVQQVSKQEIVLLMKQVSPNIKYFETDLFKLNKPNYSIVFTF